MLVHVAALAEPWIWNDRPYAASRFSCPWQMDCEEPRSTWIHCGSLNALDQRVPVLPSTAAEAGKVAFSVDDAVAGRPCAALAVLHPPVGENSPMTWNSNSE